MSELVQALQNESDFDSLTGSGVVLVDFYADWCMPCRALKPILDQIAAKYQGKAVVLKVDTEQFKALTVQFDVSGIPALFLFKDGQVVQRFVGLQQAATLEAALDQVL